MTSTCSAPTYAASYTAASSCASTSSLHIHNLGAAYSGALYEGSPTDCVADGNTVAGTTYYSVGAEIAPSSFTPATVQAE